MAGRGQLDLLKRSIDCFLNQTYPNRELIIASDESTFFQSAIQRYLDHKDAVHVYLLKPAEHTSSIDTCYNLAWNEATGTYVCLWEGQHQHHSRRLEVQYTHLTTARANASFMVDQLALIKEHRSLCLIERPQPQGGTSQLILNSMLSENTAALRFTSQNGKTLDTSIIDQMVHQGFDIAGLAGEAPLFLYQIPENEALTDTSLPSACAEKVKQSLPVILEALKQYDIPTPLTIMAGTQNIGVYDHI